MDSLLACPRCRRSLEQLSDSRLRCPEDGSQLVRERGIWRSLTEQQTADTGRFLADYRCLRRDEGWGSSDPAYYRALPFHDGTGRHAEIWRVRAASYRLLQRKLLAGPRRSVADLGAGNCWLAWRLSEDGHASVAVDLSDDEMDGLGALDRYAPNSDLLRIRTTFDRVPLSDSTLDLAIFNGSIHYSADIRATLTEARRMLRSGGRIVIMDSPMYRFSRSGRNMLRERHETWRRRYGEEFASPIGEGFLTRRRLRRLGAALGLRWQLCPLPLGWRWRLAPIAALARGRREPARFPLVLTQPIGPARDDNAP